MTEVGIINISCWNTFWPFRRKHKNIQAQRNDELQVSQSGLTDRISDLPDEILCYILSLLTLRDSVRTRLLAVRWRYLCDSRSVLHFDALNVFGRETLTTASKQSKFVRVVNQFIKLWKSRKGWNLHGITIHFPLRNKYTSHIDRWIQSFISMGIKDLEVNTFSLDFKKCKRYKFSSSRLLDSRVKRLSLGYCTLTLLTLSSECTSWINHLTTLDLYHVDLKKEETDFILSNALSLTSLKLVRCLGPSPITVNIELPSLQKLVFHEHVDGLVLNCPNLEIFECTSHVRCFNFSHVPLLRRVNLGPMFDSDVCSLTFHDLTVRAPELEALSLSLLTAVSQLPANNYISRLKRLDVEEKVPTYFDVLVITHFLNACPFLEVLHLKLCSWDYTKRLYSTRKEDTERKYPDRPHYNLNEVKLDRFRKTGNEMELA